MSQTRSELIKKIREQRRLDKNDDKRGLAELKDGELLEIEDERPDNVFISEVKDELEPEPEPEPEPVEEKNEPIYSSSEEINYSPREAKKLIKDIANNFKKLVDELISETKEQDIYIEDLMEEHNYEKDKSKYEIEDILDQQKKIYRIIS